MLFDYPAESLYQETHIRLWELSVEPHCGFQTQKHTFKCVFLRLWDNKAMGMGNVAGAHKILYVGKYGRHISTMLCFVSYV